MSPLGVHAATITEWNLSETNRATEWRTRTLDRVEAKKDGLYIGTRTEGVIMREGDFPAADVLTLHFDVAQPMEAKLLWKNSAITETGFISLPIILEGNATTIELTLHDEWNTRPEALGINFPPGAELVLKRIEFKRWNVFEKLMGRIQSFWNFDTLQFHSVNYLWGPHIVSSPTAVSEIHNQDPPYGSRPMYCILGLLIFLSIIAFATRKRSETGWKVLIGGIIFFWLLLDLRMGLEFMSYAKHDWKTYISQPTATKELREFEMLHATVVAAMPHIETNSFLLLAPRYNLVFNIVRYMSYPKVPELEFKSHQYVLVYDHSNVRLSERGTFERRDGFVYGSGTLVKAFTDKSYLVKLQ